MNDLAIKNKLSSLEKPAELFFTLDPFTPENGILTATMKMKRNQGKEVYQTQIDEMYAKLAAVGK